MPFRNPITKENFEEYRDYLNNMIDRLEDNFDQSELQHTHIKKLEKIIENQKEEIENFKKVSVISSLNKQVSEKDGVIKTLTSQLESSKQQIEKLRKQLKDANDLISGFQLESVSPAPNPVSPSPEPVSPAPELVSPAPEPVSPAPSSKSINSEETHTRVTINSKVYYVDLNGNLCKKLKSGKYGTKSYGIYRNDNDYELY